MAELDQEIAAVWKQYLVKNEGANKILSLIDKRKRKESYRRIKFSLGKRHLLHLKKQNVSWWNFGR